MKGTCPECGEDWSSRQENRGWSELSQLCPTHYFLASTRARQARFRRTQKAQPPKVAKPSKRQMAPWLISNPELFRGERGADPDDTIPNERVSAAPISEYGSDSLSVMSLLRGGHVPRRASLS